jgi:thioredoxin 1
VTEILDVTDATFEDEVLQSDRPVLVDFWAEWCAPCRRLAPVIAEIASEYDGRLRVAKVDVDANPNITSNLSIRAMPTLLLFKAGKVANSLVGAHPKDKITEQIDQLLG